MKDKTQKVAQMLLKNRGPEDKEFWAWLRPNQPTSMKDANKFVLASILDYQMNADFVWKNTGHFAEHILGDPKLLWQKITGISLEDWKSKKKEYSLHRFPIGHRRVWTIGKLIVEQYDGDARKIWQDQSIEATLHRLNDLGAGEQISRMIVGALIDNGQVKGKSDVKVDLHVRRVLGRILRAREFSELEKDKVLEITRKMHPENPWLLDRPLYLLGKKLCKANNPKCADCFMQSQCAYYGREQ